MNKISVQERLLTLEKRNNRLKSILLHYQLKHGNYSYGHLEDRISLVLKEYRINKSIAISAINCGITPGLAIKWFVEGQKGNPYFEKFYAGIKKVNYSNFIEKTEVVVEDNDYEIENVGGSWIYTTYVDGKKISVISSDLKHLKERVYNKNLPIVL